MTAIWGNDVFRALTAADVAQAAAALPLTPWGRRGYDKAPVDELLALVRDALTANRNEITGLADHRERIKQQFIASQRGNPEDWLATAADEHKTAIAMLSEAQAAIERMLAGARADSARITRDAEAQAGARLAEAERVLADAQVQARTQARDAADAALDEPVPAQAHGPLRTARAQAAYDGKFNGVYLDHVIMATENLQHQVGTIKRMLANWKDKELGAPGPGAADSSPQSTETAIAREESR